MEQRLAAVLAADVARYSRLMWADEEGTLARRAAVLGTRLALAPGKRREHASTPINRSLGYRSSRNRSGDPHDVLQGANCRPVRGCARCRARTSWPPPTLRRRRPDRRRHHPGRGACPEGERSIVPFEEGERQEPKGVPNWTSRSGNPARTGRCASVPPDPGASPSGFPNGSDDVSAVPAGSG